ncbi:MAG: DUF4123 domain-containing protein [Deltaproteobacteria bacterium]|jgi:hypothetical protein|nr:DUF4123 domain-containing protein [Deltaproteobacteria bacterium]
MNEALREQDKKAMLSEVASALADGLDAFAMVDPLADDSLIPQFFTLSPDLPYAPLFLETPLAHLLEATPYYCRIPSADDPYFAFLADLPTSWGFVAIGAVSLELSLAHWRSLLRVRSQTGVTHFRFYDGETLVPLGDSLTADEQGNLLGPHLTAHARGRRPGGSEASWHRLSRPGYPEQSARAVADAYSLRHPPWWVFTERHWQAFADRRPGILANNIAEYLFAEFPLQAGRQHGQTGLESFALAQIKRGMELGLTGSPALTAFVSCCLLRGEDFPAGSPLEKNFTPGMAEETLVPALQALCAKETMV